MLVLFAYAVSPSSITSSSISFGDGVFLQLISFKASKNSEVISNVLVTSKTALGFPFANSKMVVIAVNRLEVFTVYA